MTDSDDIELSNAQKSLLETIREKSNDDGKPKQDSRGYSTPSVKQVSGTHGSIEGIDSGSQGNQSSTNRRKKRSTPVEGTVSRHGEGSRPSITTGKYPLESNGTTSEGYQSYETSGLNPLVVDNFVPENVVTSSVTPEDIEREKQLNAQRQKRFRDNKKQAQSEAVTVTNPVTPKFSLKNPFGKDSNATADSKPKEDVKLISRSEVEDLVTDLAFIYEKGSGILDDILQIVVKDHEEVTIWELDNDEALILARMHLERGRVDKQAAQSARKLIELHDKIFFIMLLGPKFVKTGQHIKEHGGVSFK